MKKTINIHNSQLISIILPVKNGERYLCEALDSIRAQTYKNWEMIIIDDGSTDTTPSILASYAKRDDRIKIVTNKRSTGISKALNRGIRFAKGDFIARMDADDISYPTRLAKQIKYLNRHPEVVAIGTQCHIIDGEGNITGAKTFPTSHKEIYDTVFSFNPLQHPTLMINRGLIPKKIRLYDHLDGAEDLYLLFKLFPFGKVENMKETLLAYRIHGENSSFKKIKKIYHQALQARIHGVTQYGYVPTLKNIFLTVAQTVVVAILPEILIRKLYFYARGIKDNVSQVKKMKLIPSIIRA